MSSDQGDLGFGLGGNPNTNRSSQHQQIVMEDSEQDGNNGENAQAQQTAEHTGARTAQGGSQRQSLGKRRVTGDEGFGLSGDGWEEENTSGSAGRNYGTTNTQERSQGGEDNQASESTPLFSREHRLEEDQRQENNTDEDNEHASLLQRVGLTNNNKKPWIRRWPSIAALTLLCAVVIVILVLVFMAPEITREYGERAMVIEPQSLSIVAFTATGAIARVVSTFSMDASRVSSGSTRNLGRFFTWVAKEIEIKPSSVEVSLPEYGDVVVGHADIPAILLNIQDGHTTLLDFETSVEPGRKDGIRRVAKDYLDGKLGQLRVQGKSKINLKSGLFISIAQTVIRDIVFQGSDIPSMPKYDIGAIKFNQAFLPNNETALLGSASVEVENPLPVSLTVPPLGFVILAPNCAPDDPHIPLAHAMTQHLVVEPKKTLRIDVSAIVKKLPDVMLENCPGTKVSPLDSILEQFLHGNETLFYVRGSESPTSNTPHWISDITSSLTVPVALPGHSLGHLVEKFKLQNVKFSLPDVFADPDSPESSPKITADIWASINLPEEVKFPIDVYHMRAKADISYLGRDLGYLDLKKWQPASSRRRQGGNSTGLEIESHIEKAPLIITDQDTFSKVVSDLLLGSETLHMSVDAKVGVELSTALGTFVVKNIPAQGDFPVKPMTGRGDGFKSLKPEFGSLRIIETTPDTITIAALVNFTNPTNYSASVPFAAVDVLTNGTALARAIAEDLAVGPGRNVNVPIKLVWQPSIVGGHRGKLVGRELISQYLSGFNTTLTLKTFEGTIPAQPGLGRALSKVEFTFPTPKLHKPKAPGDGDGEGEGHFISDTTMHLFTSTATFVLHSPLQHNTLYLTFINATAIYQDEVVGRITVGPETGDPDTFQAIEVPPGVTETPRLPVDWTLDSVGYDAIKAALGGTLKLDAYADAGVKIENWSEKIWFAGKGIGAKIRI